jgi:hypothetical protein
VWAGAVIFHSLSWSGRRSHFGFHRCQRDSFPAAHPSSDTHFGSCVLHYCAPDLVFFQLSRTGQTWCIFVAVPCRSISCRRLIFLYLLTDFSTGLLTTQSRASRSAPQSRPFPLAAKAEARHSFSLTIFWVLSFPGGWFSSAHSVSWLFLLAAGLIWFPGFTCDSHTSQRQCKLCVLLIE